MLIPPGRVINGRRSLIRLAGQVPPLLALQDLSAAINHMGGGLISGEKATYLGVVLVHGAGADWSV